MEWTRKSSSPHSLVDALEDGLDLAGPATSSGMKIGASSSRASGSTYVFAFSLR